MGPVLDLRKWDGAPMLMVGVDAAEVERQLCAGELACPGCEAVLAPWGSVPGRQMRGRDGTIDCGVRRSRCAACPATHVLLPVSAFWRRLDASETILLAVMAHSRGMGQRRVAAGLGLPEATVRGWLRRARFKAAVIRNDFMRLGHERFGCDLRLEPLLGPLGDALNVIGVVARAAVQQLGPMPAWHFVSGATSGDLLRNTSAPFPAPLMARQAAAIAVVTTRTASTEGDAANERPPP